MSKRKSSSARTRFEVFKRDGFTCQHCGQKPPAIVLHCDHIIAVANDGTNDESNLITSCEACNLGKSDRPVSDRHPGLQQLREREQERTEQLREYEEFLREQRNAETLRFNQVAQHWLQYCFNNEILSFTVEKSLRIFLKRLPLPEIIEAIDIAYLAKPGSDKQRHLYFCGICWRKIKGIPDA